ncbi:probable inactive poly [ADP-ribose] polymerase SRO2 [Hevea brasiliensis]|uniref:probable inactive poly [ADP-ribose] polymerase SRO2 n=1 Tax=Hevea brasiliensis TaxID=3981 RepID=UPI0025F7318C|nr:probable inactive poly [ADP-ribose] polymerase SRO2 [Hevea brasiliensis]
MEHSSIQVGNTNEQNDSIGLELEDLTLSDGESGSSGANSGQFPGFGLVPLFEGDNIYDLIKRRFLSGLGSLGNETTVAMVHKNTYCSIMGQARMQSFLTFTKATENKCCGDPNVKCAWFGATVDEICNTMKNGFDRQINDNSGLYGCGIYLSADDSLLQTVKNSRVDKDGLGHLLLCRVILGTTEVVLPGSEQCHPSSEEFDSGIDNLSSPKTYIVQSNRMNTHILPEFVVSFKAPSSLKGFFMKGEPAGIPTSPCRMSFPGKQNFKARTYTASETNCRGRVVDCSNQIL